MCLVLNVLIFLNYYLIRILFQFFSFICKHIINYFVHTNTHTDKDD